jgi:hypothetical protein
MSKIKSLVFSQDKTFSPWTNEKKPVYNVIACQVEFLQVFFKKKHHNFIQSVSVKGVFS